MKWRKVCPASTSLSLPDNISCVSRIPTDSTDSCFPSRKPPGSGEFRILSVATACSLHLFSHFYAKSPAWPARLLRAVSFFLQIHMENPRAQAASAHEGRGSCPTLVGTPSAPGRCLAALPLQRPSVRKMCWRKSPPWTRN